MLRHAQSTHVRLHCYIMASKGEKKPLNAWRRVNRLLLRNDSVCRGKGKHARVIDSILAPCCCSIAAAAADGFSI